MTGESSNSASARSVIDLDGAELALWVARAAGMHITCDTWQGADVSFVLPALEAGGPMFQFRPQISWEQGGPLIERANIHLSPPTSPVHRCGGPNAGNGPSGHWSACTWHRGADGHRSFGWHETSPLIAAMRCFVRSVYGKTVLGAQP